MPGPPLRHTTQHPTSWKKADVVSVPKKGGVTCRQVLLLPPLSKIFERVLAEKTPSFLEENRSLTTSSLVSGQKGRQKRNSCTWSISGLQRCPDKKEVEVVFLDCTKVFDRVPHEVLVRSLQDRGITGDLLQLLSDYLRGRTQRVTVGGYYSDDSEVRSGVPQSSVLGPVVFIVAVNKLSDSVKCELSQYADDLVANCVIGKPQDC
ncbi:RvY_16707-1 [Ramazzottius varieornatus]|uniref:RvY_16707-1 protein ( RvY_16707.1protein, RvY_16707.2 protein ) n=1 Tax=Ramazzottius varieornatus TaxID=947166 RepID=A0A1D1W0L1_RAMVA|nr:RvY_16707-1 [Ramazzottius varieornatus]